MSANTARRRRAQAKLLPKSLRVRRLKPARGKPLPMSPAFTKKANAKGMKRRTANIDIRVAPELVEKIDAWRAQQRVPPTGNVYTILRPGRGPSDDEIQRLLRVHQGGIAVFFHALRNELGGAPEVIIEA